MEEHQLEDVSEELPEAVDENQLETVGEERLDAVEEEQPATVNAEQPQAANENRQADERPEEAPTEEKASAEDRYQIFDYEEARRLEDEARARIQVERTAFLQKLMRGPDVISWVVPKDGVVADEVLREHMAQLQNVVRYALQYAVADGEPVRLNLSAAATATNMIRANIALAKALAASDPKTVRGVDRRGGLQD